MLRPEPNRPVLWARTLAGFADARSLLPTSASGQKRPFGSTAARQHGSTAEFAQKRTYNQQ